MPILINGMGGIGKTTLAAYYLNTYYDEYDHILWLTFDKNIESSISENISLIHNLKINDASIDSVTNIALNRIRTIVSNNPNLLIIDNAGHELTQKLDSLPSYPGWHVLLTSRYRLSPCVIYDIGFLSEKKAIELFQSFHSKFNKAQVKELVNQVGRHTLAIEVLAKSASKNHYNFEQLKIALSTNSKSGVDTFHSNYQTIDKIKTYFVQIFSLDKLDPKENLLLRNFIDLPNNWIESETIKKLIAVNNETWHGDFFFHLENLYEKGYLQKIGDSFKMHEILNDILEPILYNDLDEYEKTIRRATTKIRDAIRTKNPLYIADVIKEGENVAKSNQLRSQELIVTLLYNIGQGYHLLYQLQQIPFLPPSPFPPLLPFFMSNIPNPLEKARKYLEDSLSLAKKNYGEFHGYITRGESKLGMVYKNLGMRMIKDDNNNKDGIELLEKGRNLVETACEKIKSDKTYGEKYYLLSIRENDLAMIYNDLATVKKDKQLHSKAIELLEKSILKALDKSDLQNAKIRISNLEFVLSNNAFPKPLSGEPTVSEKIQKYKDLVLVIAQKLKN